MWLIHNPVMAALPTPVNPDSGTAAAGDYLDYIKWHTKDILLVAGLFISTIGFLIVAFVGFQKFNEARRGKAEWNEVLILALVGAGLLVFAGFLLNESTGVIT